MNRDHAAASYADLAGFYDRFTAAHNHDAWAQTLELAALAHGLDGRRVLEVACGTGNLLVPFLERGYEVTGCDISPEMLELAKRKVGRDVPLFVADVRRLPAVGRFDLALCIGDVFNYLLEVGDLDDALASIRAVLAPGGIALFDVNTLWSYRTVFATDRCFEDDRGLLTFRGRGRPDVEPGAQVESIVDAFTAENGHWTRATSRHVHRHHRDADIRRAIEAAGLRCIAAYGVTPDGELHPEVLELRHTKRLYVAGPVPSPTPKGERDASAQEARDARRSGRRLHEGQLDAAPSPGAPAPGEGSSRRPAEA